MTDLPAIATIEADLRDLAEAIAGCRDAAQVRRLQLIRRSRLAELEALRRSAEGDRA